MRFGLIGCGGIGWLRAEALSQSQANQLVAASDLESERASALAHKFGCAVEPDWLSLIQRDDLEAIIISTPPSLHAEMCIAWLKAGKHVLCEKPLVRNPQEGLAILEVANQTGRFVATGFNYRFYPSFIKARQLLDSGIIGELDHIRSYAGYTAADHNHAWLHDYNIMGGGALRDNGIHLIDLTHYFLGSVAEVKGFATNSVWGFEGCEDNGFALLRSTSGKIAVLQASWNEWDRYQFKLEIYGQRGIIRASCFPMITQVLWAEERGGRTKQKTFNFPKVFLMEHLRSYRWVVVQSFLEEYEAFAEAVNGEKTAIATGFDGIRAVEIADEAAKEFNEQFLIAHVISSKVNPAEQIIEEEAGRPDISVVVVPLAGEDGLAGCLEALAKQQGAPTFDVIVPCDNQLGDLSDLQMKYPLVRFLRLSERRTYAELRAAGVAQTTGRIIAVTEDQCRPNPNWCAQIFEAHKYSHAVIGGGVEKETPDNILNWSIYFADYLRYAPPFGEGTSFSLTDLNVSYKRLALDKIKSEWKDEFHENVVHAALRKQNEILWLSPEIIVNQKRSFRFWEAIHDRYSFGRLLAFTRVAHSSKSARIKLSILSVLIPAVLMLRMMMLIYRKKRWTGMFIRCIPALTLLSIAWGWGEFIGYLTAKPAASLASRQSQPASIS